MNNRKRRIYYFLTSALICSFLPFEYINGMETGNINQDEKTIKNDGNNETVSTIFYKIAKYYRDNNISIDTLINRKRGLDKEKSINTKIESVNKKSVQIKMESCNESSLSILDSFGIANDYGMGYKIEDDMTSEAKTLIKLISILKSQLKMLTIKNKKIGNNRIGLSLRIKKRPQSILPRCAELSKIISSFSSDEDQTNLDIWYNALCRTACNQENIPNYMKKISDKKNKKIFSILYSYRKYLNSKCKEDSDIEQQKKNFKYDPDMLSNDELESAVKQQEKINSAIKQILRTIESTKNTDKDKWWSDITGGTWCQFKVFEGRNNSNSQDLIQDASPSI